MNASEHQRDRLVLDELRKRGDGSHIPRPVYIWIYGSQSELALVADRLAQFGWQETDPNPTEKDWLIRAEREQLTTEQDIFAMSDQINEAIAGTNAEYDGWETSVEVPS